MTLKQKFVAIQTLLLLTLIALILGWFFSISNNNRELASLKSRNLTLLKLSWENESKLRQFNHSIEIALNAFDPLEVEDASHHIDEIHANLQTLKSLKLNITEEHIFDLTGRLTKLKKQAESFVTMISDAIGRKEPLNNAKITSLALPLRKNGAYLQGALLEIKRNSVENFSTSLENLKKFNTNVALNMTIIFAVVAAIIFFTITIIFRNFSSRLTALGEHLSHTDLFKLEQIDQTNRSHDEISDLITSSNRMIDNIHESRKQLVDKEFVDAIIDSMGEMLIILDCNGRVIKSNVVSSMLLGYPGQELNQKHIYELLECEDREVAGYAHKEYWENLTQDKIPVVSNEEVSISKRNGSRLSALLSISPLTLGVQADEINVVCSLRDITDLKTIEAEKTELNQQLIQASKLATIGTLASGVAHELANPLAGIKGYLGLLPVTENLTEKGQKFVERSDKLVYRMTAIIDHIRKFSRTSKEDEKKSVNINVPIEESLILLGHVFVEKGIEVETTFTEAPYVFGDHNQLESIFQNLFNNSKDAFLESSEEKKRITVKTIVRDGSVIVEYTDNAGGIPDDIVNKVFDAFFTTKQEGEGTGLGMSVSRDIVEKHSGRMLVNSNPPKGTTFLLEFPLCDEKPETENKDNREDDREVG